MASSPGTFITGATGFIGGALLDRLLADRRSVRVLVRTDSAAEKLAARGVEPVIGDLANESALSTGVRSVDTVFHVAGVNEMCTLNPDAMMAGNVDGTLAVFRAAAAAGVSCMVYTSSAVTVGHAGKGRLADETMMHDRVFVSHYERSKYEAEVALFEAARSSSVRVVAVNPVSVQGPGRTGGSARLLLGILKQDRPILPATTVSLVDIADCVQGHLLAEAHGVHRARYLLSGAVVDTKQAAALLGEVVNTNKRPIVIPVGVVRAVGLPVAWLLNRLGKTSVCPEMVRTLVKGHAYDGSKATRDLGLAYTPIEDTMRTTVAWYRSEGLLGK
jgi:dihydroflavonol-4-reductase